MAHHDDVLHLDDIYGELQHRKIIGVLWRGEIGDIAMDEQFAGRQVHDLIGGNAAVGTADPQILRTLLALQPLEEFRIQRNHAFRPGPVIGFQIV